MKPPVPPRPVPRRPSPWRMAELEERVHAAENLVRERDLRRSGADGTAPRPAKPLPT